jgi:ABC-2 type transport system permease protein
MSTASARVEDVRYSRYEGELRGRGAATWSLARFGAVGALGARRSWRAKIVPIALISIAFLPAFVVLGLKAFVGNRFKPATVSELIPYNGYYIEIGITVLLMAAVITPQLLCPERRDNVLSLLFATAIEPREYVGGKVVAAVLPLSLVTTLPVLVLFAGNTIFADHPLGYVESYWLDVPRILVAGTFLGLYFGLTGLAVASLTKRRAFAMGGYLATVILSGAVAGTLVMAANAGAGFRLLALGRVPIVTARTLFRGDPSTNGVAYGWWWATSLGVMAMSILVLLWRYRSAEI